jgi:peptidoglycan-associated lipoprotein
MIHAFSRKALFILVSSALLLSVGCQKKPRRDPSQTVIGNQPGVLNPNELGGFGSGFNDGTTEPGSGLEGREGVIETEDMIRGLLQPVYFAYDSSAIAAPERDKLAAAKAYIDANPQYRLLVEGRADWRGTTDYNLGLGDRRAAAAKQYLTSLGLPDTKVETLSKGDLEAVENASEDIMTQDRRADLVILKK